MLFEVVLHDGYADPPTTHWIAGIEGPNATVALQRNLAKVIEAAEDLCGRCDEVHFTRRDLIRLIYVLRKDTYWLPAQDVAWDLVQ